MLRYITAASIAALLLAVALRARSSDETGPAPAGEELTGAQPEVEAVAVPGGVDLKLKHRFAGSVSRASLVYEYDGAQRTLDHTTNCRKSLGKLKGDGGYSSQVELGGRLPEGFRALRLILEDETGTRVMPVSVQLD